MSAQDHILDYSDDADDDEVQAIIAAFQKRKEKIAKLKKTVRERSGRVQKQLNQDSENRDPKISAYAEQVIRLRNQLDTMYERSSHLPPIACDVSKRDQEEVSVAKQNLRKAGENAKTAVENISTKFEKKLRKVVILLESEAVRSRDSEIFAAFESLRVELERARHVVSVCADN